MTTDVMESGVNLDQPTSSTNVSESSISSTPNSEDVVPKSRVQEIVQERTKQAAQKAYERGIQEAEQKRANMGMGGMSDISEDKIRLMMSDVFKQQHAELQRDYEQKEVRRQLDQLASDFMGKLDAARDRFPDLEKRRNELGDLSALVPYINESEDVAGVTQHLLDNEQNFASLLVLSHTSPEKARRAIKRLSDSIKLNETAKNRQYPNEPLGQVTPSIPTDNDSGSIEALKRQPWLRG